MKKYMNIIFIVFLCSILIMVIFGGEKTKRQSVEDLGISVGVGIGINKNVEGNITYRVSTTANEYKEDGTVETLLGTGIGSTIGKTRENRQKKTGKEFFLGLSKIYIVDEEYAKYGIRDLIDVNFKNPVVNDNAFLVVCKGRSEDYLKYTSPSYDNSAEYISDMIKNSVNYNFFKEDYMFKDAFLSIDAEGKNVVSPYIEIIEDGIKIKGMAVFNKDKLAVILDMKDTKIMNMLRENKVKGILTIQKDSDKYVNYQAEAKRKITCRKIGDKYTFIIDLDLKGEIVNNELYKGMVTNLGVTKRFEDDMAKQVEEMCNGFLGRMKNKYRVDLLQLGWVATAKYGRDTGVDWNEIVSNSEIKVNVKVHVDKLGRGQY
ncbi:Ger(x)C family spore germination protein [Clostridium estertheticum]|uniref:Ger(x)C family spore germination protein n=1 Tax=Clostridium estertheticum TaxID=238834 RepID=UPI001CF3CE2C|nr:Ger(x)C family spore germination protein [Clostridium estertheticum]MCB2305416.1 Ger(x)C family spore germination protein [Clostridium estertheticum]MCB2343854.1 Ger(x)C family spore germination protein [Clostridium estertheticum]MCB2348772.1 Ger(x)C family spore germination protein [Clostridium estertheticum]WAG46094.1 Ger(x)C family spore germination protein [Clostridium estertheticum]